MKPVLFLLAAAVLAGCGENKPVSPDFVVGMDLSYPPFETIDASGRPTGVSVDLARDLARDLGRPLRIENLPFVGLIPALKSGRVDVVISSMTDTPERRKAIAFSEPYATIGLALLTARSSSLQGAADLDQPGRTLAVRQGTTGEVWARANLQRARILSLEKESSAVLEVLQGRADAFLYDQMSVWTNARQHPEKLLARLEPLQRETWAIGLRPADAGLRERVNAFLRGYRRDGGFERLGDRYLGAQKAAFKAQGVPFVF